jgi:hypothetical protein
LRISSIGNNYIQITGTIVYKDGGQATVDLNMNFDKAIENLPGAPSELIVPDAFKVYVTKPVN